MKRASFALIVVILFFLAIEGGLRLVSYRGDLTVMDYRLQVTVALGRSEGDHSVSVTVQEQDSSGGGGGGDDEGFSLTYFVVSVIIVLAVAMPVTYYVLVSKKALKMRVRRVHEEIVEIVDEEE